MFFRRSANIDSGPQWWPETIEREEVVKLNPYLHFDGNCAEAFRFYADLFGGELELMTMEQTPMADQLGPEWKGRTMHAYLKIGDQALMASDTEPGQEHKVSGMSVALHFEDETEGERVFKGLSEGGNVTMELQQTFWAKRFGMVTDRFGTPWLVNVA